MARMERRDVACYACQTSVSIYVWHVLDVAEYPDLKRQLLADTVNVVPCPTCSRRCRCDIPLRYDDPVIGFAVQFIPDRYRTDPDFLQLCTDAGTLPAGDPRPTDVIGAEREPHVVFSMDEMIRYVVFRDRITAFARRRY